MIFHNQEQETFHMGDIILERGHVGDAMYVLLEGNVEIYVEGKCVEDIQVGQIFGEMALIDSAHRSATAIAASDVTVAVVDQARFEYLVQQTPHFATLVMTELVERLRRYNQFE